ncbi:MAG: SDR family oxidoreductase [Pseudomonadales bacterium]|nr:SDR family oxidoreductase [Pseudomonadales bacterium]
MDPLFDMTDKNVLVTGGSRGLGREMALAFAERGANLLITSRKIDNCVNVAREIESFGVKALAHACHLGHWQEIEELVDVAYKEFGHLDVLINNAGMSPLYPSLSEVSEELFDKVINLNLKAPFRLSALVGERMQKRGSGSILNISSIAALHPSPDSEPYGAAKAGINALSRSLAFAYGPEVRVNSIVAGPFLTDISKAWDMPVFEEKAEQTMALGRAGRPEEIVAAALYLCSEAASFTTGAVLRVDGGSP